MQRRTFLRALTALPWLRLPKAQPSPPPATPIYTDSDGNTIASELNDGDRATGITYAA